MPVYRSEKAKVLRALLRWELGSFVRKCFHTVAGGEIYRPNWHVDAMAWYLKQCMDGAITRLVITQLSP